MIIKHYKKGIKHSVLVPEYLLQRMQGILKVHFPCEFGGILAGYKEVDQYIIVDIEIPIKYKQTETDFTRHPDNLNNYLKEIYEHSKGRIEYLGEWHSHPSASPKFSPRDFISVKEIASDFKSRTAEPLLIIFGITNNKFHYHLYKYYEEELILLDKKIKI